MKQDVETKVDLIFSAVTEINQLQATTSAANSSFQKQAEIRPLPKRNAKDQLKYNRKRAAVGSKLITSTSVKEPAKEKLKQKNEKKP